MKRYKINYDLVNKQLLKECDKYNGRCNKCPMDIKDEFYCKLCEAQNTHRYDKYDILMMELYEEVFGNKIE